MRPARRPRERPRAVRVCDVRWKVRVLSRSNDAFAREIAARGDAWGENSDAESDVSSVANGHPAKGIEWGCERRRERAGGAARGRGDANNRLASIRPRARCGGRTARSRRGARDGARSDFSG